MRNKSRCSYTMMNNNPIPVEVIASDIVVLQSLESYMNARNVRPDNTRPDEYLRYYQDASNVFYSDIVQRTPRLVAYINSAPEADDKASAFKIALAHHMRDKNFMTLLEKQLAHDNNEFANALVGSFVCEALRMYFEDMKKLDDEANETAKAEKKKDDKAQAPLKSHVDPETVESMMSLGKLLLKKHCAFVQSKFVKMSDSDVIAVASLLAMGNDSVAYALLDSDIAVTADVFDCPLLTNDQLPYLYAGILRLKKADWVKLSVNQTKLVESMTKWIYNRLNCMDPTLCLQLLVWVYGSVSPAEYVKTCLIQPKDCGSQYPNLKQVAISLKIN